METRMLLATAVLSLSTLNIVCVYFHLLPWYAPHALLVVGTVCGLRRFEWEQLRVSNPGLCLWSRHVPVSPL
jgi:hypothetical protein